MSTPAPLTDEELAAKARMEQTHAENAAGIVEFTDLGDRAPRRYRLRVGGIAPGVNTVESCAPPAEEEQVAA